MQFGREIHRLMLTVLGAFAVVALSAAYWSVFGADSILLREDNPRLVEAEASIVRGDIVDRHGETLVTSHLDAEGILIRQYLYPEMNGALGYFSLRYGVGGAEAAFDTVLRGDDLVGGLTDYFEREVLHRPQRGSSVQLTFDLDIQRHIIAAMQGHTGAAIVLAVPTGQVLSLVSLPTYDPNTLDQDWETLAEAPGNPFFNRVLQGNYQPGGMLQTPLMVSALAINQPLDVTYENADTPVNIAATSDGTSSTFAVNCVITPPTSTLTLVDAYIYGCPLPFAQMADTLGIDTLQNAFRNFLMNNPPTLAGFVVQPEDATAVGTPVPTSTPFALNANDLEADALGQGQLTMTPLHIAVIMAALVNNGNAPQPYALLGVRAPDASTWTSMAASHATMPLTSAENAALVRDWMRAAVADGTAQAAAQPGLDIGGQAALAYSGEGSKTWFAGFATLEGGGGVVVVIVLENSDDPQEAARIGGEALLAAAAGVQADP